VRFRKLSANPAIREIKSLISTIVSHGKTGNMRAVVQTLHEVEKRTKSNKNNPQIQELLAQTYRHSLDPFGVAKKFKDVESMLLKIEHILKVNPTSENIQEYYSEALNASVFHYIMNEREKEVHQNLTKLGAFANKHQTNPFVQFNYAQALSRVAEFFANKEDKEVTYNILWEIIGIVTFYPGKEILTQVSDGLLQCVDVAGNRLNMGELEDLATRIDEFINFTNEFDTQQKLTACQGRIFQFIAGLRMRSGYSPDGKPQNNLKK
jgi:hypothetical protein